MDFSLDLDHGGRLTVRGAGDDGTVTNADVELVEPNGQRWSATVMTLPEVDRLMETWRASGECQGGAYFRVPDLFIVRNPDQDAVSRVFAELYRAGQHRYEMSPLADK